MYYSNLPCSSRGFISSRDIHRVLSETRQILVFVHLFNISFANLIFTNKVFSINIAIFGSFFAIHEITGDVILRILLGVASSFIIIFYTIIYDKGFQVSQNFTQIKNRFQPLIRKSNFRKAEMKRAIIGIRSLGIQVGSFHTLERQSTLIFLDFILKQIVGLLITFS